MGKTNRPLVIWVAPEWWDQEKITDLRTKGHTIVVMDWEALESVKPDLILHPNAWRWHDGQWDNLEVALKEARKGLPVKAAAAPAKAGKQRGGRKGSRGAAVKSADPAGGGG